ncbi:methylmalonyl Co-A mutase-associated GTPase MeaB [Persicitalea jodogahamensis]|uniref:ATPase/protein kinase n=1 Tax=Persicitalea jodogahamensis TaxID=402147 RepID=A0A8J3G7U4_9BACT|nr:methylmalonyl Co-A mutase-associated GTPase MeaB [Persicitalea jodogahamensis]GHB53672.1 ATPase/protein kinase [Persicitalea jodogahamensis]
MRPRLTTKDYIDGILNGDRMVLSRAITLVESRLSGDRELAQQVLMGVLPHTGNSSRIGITGVPGVGKSTFIEVFGQHVVSMGKSLAVLTVDPSSQRSGGSILGDKTRMEVLSHHPLAYIRPSATGSSLGGVAHRTREAMLLCEAAGYEIILIETVGVGQSETLVRSMTDFFLLLMLAGAGDELQGIKKGIMEMADAIAITKTDGSNRPLAEQAVSEYRNALHLFSLSESGWNAPVVTCSATENEGIGEIWDLIQNYLTLIHANGYFHKSRQNQNVDWLRSLIRQQLEDRFFIHPEIAEQWADTEQAVRSGVELPLPAAQRLLHRFFKEE